MKRARVVIAAAIALAGCRSIIGIEVLDYVGDGGAGSGQDATVNDVGDAAVGTSDAHDASTVDAFDAGADAISVAIAACVAQTGTCPPCCHMTFPNDFPIWNAYAIDSGCICGAGACAGADACAGSVCADPPIMTGIPQECNSCLDHDGLLIASPACGAARTACNDDPSCKAASDCYAACFSAPPPGDP